MKNQKGVTLIALVITIIVLIILAAVSIAMLTGDNGILDNAETAKNDTNNSSIADKINMELNAFKSDILSELDKKITANTFNAAYDSLSGYTFKIDDVAVDKTSFSTAYTDTAKKLTIEKDEITGTIYLQTDASNSKTQGQIDKAVYK